MTDILMQYGLFLAKAVTVVVMAWIIIAMVVSMSHRRGRPPDRLEVRCLNEKYEEMSDILKEAMLSKKQLKRYSKRERRAGRRRKRENWLVRRSRASGSSSSTSAATSRRPPSLHSGKR